MWGTTVVSKQYQVETIQPNKLVFRNKISIRYNSNRRSDTNEQFGSMFLYPISCINVITMILKVLNKENIHAKTYIKEILKNNIELASQYTDQWLQELADVKCYVCYDKESNRILNVTLLSKMDFDPEKKHAKPFMLNYIYTFYEFRRRNIACRMLTYLKKKEELSAYCENEESLQLFKKANFLEYKVTEPLPATIVRFP